MLIPLLMLIAPLTVVALAVRAYMGRGTRPLYLVTMLGALVLAGTCQMLIPSRLQIASEPDERARVGGQFFFDFGPPLIIVRVAKLECFRPLADQR
jgi:hypothetical protein